MKRTLPLLCILALAAATARAQYDDDDDYRYVKVEKRYRYRVSLTDKKNSPYTLKRPGEFLSPRSLERRRRLGIRPDLHDLPVTPAYVQCLRDKGLGIHNMSKWQNTVVVETADTTLMQDVREMAFVTGVVKVWVGPDSVLVMDKPNRKRKVKNEREHLTSYYGNAQQQVEMLAADRLHEAGYRGEGMLIGILDGGFNNADVITGFNRANILGTRNFVDPSVDVYDEGSHGMMVLSCIGANTPHNLVGTAPEAQFYLIQTEDGRSEQLVEEDNYCAGLEYADSLGCDVVTASLGYYKFDDPAMNHPYSALDGQTAINSRSASMAASRGMLLLNSAGNEGNDQWKKIGFPADARDILAVGAVRSDSVNTDFSSLGFSADGRVKPDAMAMGEDAAVYSTRGNTTTANGTSFSCPILCGAVTCLWQAHRDKTPLEIIDAVHRSGHYADSPNEVFGYGIPNLWKAHELLSKKK
ncbi:MAG: S8 family serine peptidase [Alloprevotella sp.]|nr:S8 family serine peptidase [Alloprevotella sp.]